MSSGSGRRLAHDARQPSHHEVRERRTNGAGHRTLTRAPRGAARGLMGRALGPSRPGEGFSSAHFVADGRAIEEESEGIRARQHFIGGELSRSSRFLWSPAGS